MIATRALYTNSLHLFRRIMSAFARQTSVSTDSKHFVLTTIPAFGHVRAEIHLICQLVSVDPNLTCTVLASAFMVPLLQGDIHQAALPETASTRIRLIGMKGAMAPPARGTPVDFNVVMGDVGVEVPKAYRILVERGTLECTTTGRTFDYADVPPPSVAILDWCSPVIGPLIKKLTPHVYILDFCTSTATSFNAVFGPAKYGGFLDLEVQTNARMASEDKRTFDEVALEIMHEDRDRVACSAEGVEMYDYEVTPYGPAAYPKVPLPVPNLLNTVRYVRLWIR